MGIESLVAFDVEVYDYFTYDIAEDAFLPGMQLDMNRESIHGRDTYVITNNIGVCDEKIAVPNSDAGRIVFSETVKKECAASISGKNIYFDGIYGIKSFLCS